ncbi:rhodanese-like domain-containing protein [Halobacillus campisalis]|uniref:Rhodanese-like domain-containing protein n=1 Tax=Halobacillus campisalis TaxID=435909 RepID=A0ABW2K7I0_9BACI|nr:rhodanese-like domain-containing protein [Halobacillus campisalis]
MEWVIILFSITLLFILLRDFYQKNVVKPLTRQKVSGDEFCVIDIRDYISAHRSPYPGAENIPLSYLPRALKERYECTKNILLVTDDKRGAMLAARIIRKKRHKSIYYVKTA